MDSKKRTIDDSAEKHEGARNDAGQSSASDLAEKRPRTIGPALPPSVGDRDKDDEPGSDSDSDDDFGPSLPPADAGLLRTVEDKEDRLPAKEEPAPKPPGNGQRDSWMLQPPGASDWTSKVDPTKLRNRKFQSGKSAKGPGAGSQVDSAWTESPQEKIRRLQDQVMGVGAPPAPGEGRLEAAAEDSKKAEAMRERIEKYNKETRDSSQSDRMRKPPKEGKEDDDPSKRAFDREKDMSLSSKISNAQRREMVNRASDFGSRFSGGKFL
ncbi:hypothetical protein PHISP_01480 [Aspergillus sp. HF37]|nr:hypothetical protein PHISP_01480 [Aspergillus sp. HF37]